MTQQYMHVHEGVVRELWTPPDELTVDECWPEGHMIPAPEGAELGDLWDGTTLSPAPPVVIIPAPIPDITPGQLIRQLRTTGQITDAEAIAWAQKKSLPQFIENVIAALPSDQQTDATLAIYTARAIERGNPLVVAALTAQGATSDQADAFFRAASAL